MENRKFTLTEKQRLCADSVDKSLAIIAGAGSGKTAVLIERIKNIVTSGKASLGEIVAITFTEKAAGELLYRLASEIPAEFKPHVDMAVITTIDGFCNRMLREEAAFHGINPDFSVLEEHASRILNHRIITKNLKEMLKDGNPSAELMVEELDFRYAVSCMEDMVERRWSILNPKQTQNQKSKREQDLCEAIDICFQKVVTEIESEKRLLGVIDFIDLEIETLGLLKANEQIRNKHQSRIKHLLVDEYQDTSDLQTEIISYIFNPKKNILCVVGDPGQSIYGFRGANPEGISSIKELIENCGGLTIELTENFRSKEPILNFINDLFSSPSGLFLPLQAASKAEDNSGVLKLNLGEQKMTSEEKRTAEAQSIASLILDLNKSEKSNFGDIAVLFRSFTDIRIYESALNRHLIPYYRSGGRTFLIQPEITDLILCLRVLMNPKDNTLVYGLARSAIIGLSDEECYRIFTLPQSNTETPSFFEILAKDERFAFLNHLLRIRGFLSITELIREAVNCSGLHHTYSALLTSGQPMANIEKFISLAETTSTAHGCSLEEFLDYIDDLKVRDIGIDEPPIFSPRDNAVKLLTVHAAKGLEFKTVILADLGRGERNYGLPYIFGRGRQGKKSETIGFKLADGANPLADKEKTPLFKAMLDLEHENETLERDRLLYVAMTRAKDMLVLPLAGSSNSKSGWEKRLIPAASKLEEVKFEPAQMISEKKGADEISIVPPHTKPLPPKDIILTVSQLESFSQNPEEYYLKYVMKVPSGKIALPKKNMDASCIGSIVHRLIRLHSDNFMKSVCTEYGYPDPSEGDINTIMRLFQAYESSGFYHTKLKNPRFETPFAFRVGRALIRGTIDCIFEDDDGYSIVDFKTDAIKSEKEMQKKVDEYRLQILTYSIAAKMALGRGITKMSILFLDTGKVFDAKPTVKELDEGLSTINNIVEMIKERNFDII